MPKEDYLIRYLEKLARAVAAILGFRDKGNPEESIRIADGFFDENLNYRANELAIMSDSDFESLINKENHQPAILNYLAQISFETAKAYEDLDDKEKADAFFSKSLSLYRILTKKDKTFSFEREQIMNDIKKVLGEKNNESIS